jgi:hypothetical protein
MRVAGICVALMFIAWFQLDELSHRSSGSSLSANQPFITSGSLENLAGGEFLSRTSTLQSTSSNSWLTQARPLDEWEQKLYGKQGKGEDIVMLFPENSEAQLSLERIAGACSM